MRWVLVALCILVAAAAAGVTYVRSASHDPARWHVDPATVTDVNEMNEYLGSETFSASPATLASALRDALGGEVLAGDLDQGWATLVVRTPLVGYPDYISVRIEEGEESARVTLYSRSRFGKMDLGANKARVERVFQEIQMNLTGS